MKYLIRCENGNAVEGGRPLAWTKALSARIDMMECDKEGNITGKPRNSGGYTRDELISMLAEIDPKAAMRAGMSDEEMLSGYDDDDTRVMSQADPSLSKKQEALSLGIPESVNLESKKELIRWASKQGMKLKIEDFNGKSTSAVIDEIKRMKLATA